MLDILVNKNEKFVEKDTLHVRFEFDFQSCALISETEALIFSYKIITLVNFDKNIQKKLAYPSGIIEVSRSLNIKEERPHMII